MKFWYDKEFKGVVCEPNCADEWLELLWDVALDYDGCGTVDSLKELIDELVDMSNKARKCLHNGELFADKDESARSCAEAHEERKRFEDG
jgi:hypothetical protein